jgi:hypothetical protein
VFGGVGVGPSLPRDRIAQLLTKEARASRPARHRRLLQQNRHKADMTAVLLNVGFLG